MSYKVYKFAQSRTFYKNPMHWGKILNVCALEHDNSQNITKQCFYMTKHLTLNKCCTPHLLLLKAIIGSFVGSLKKEAKDKISLTMYALSHMVYS